MSIHYCPGNPNMNLWLRNTGAEVSSVKMPSHQSHAMVQSFRKFLASGRFRCFKIKQIDLIREIQKMRAGCI